MQHSSRSLTYRDVCVLGFLLLMFVGACFPAASRSREVANRIKCASNLRQIGQSLLIYAHENKGAFPRTMFEAENPNPVPTEYTGSGAYNPFVAGGPTMNDTTSPLFLLLRWTDLTSEVFICPTASSAWDVSPWLGNPQTASNFTGRVNLNYAYANPYPSSAARSMGFKMNHTLNSDFAIAADMGGAGGFAGQTPADASRAQMVKANSQNHAGDGQNVLYADGHTDWSPTIYCGSPRPVANSPRDNIYAFGVDSTRSAASAGLRGAPVDQYDSVITPAADVGPQPATLTSPTAFLFIIAGAVVLLVMAAVGIMLFFKSKRPPGGATPPPLPPMQAA